MGKNENINFIYKNIRDIKDSYKFIDKILENNNLSNQYELGDIRIS